MLWHENFYCRVEPKVVEKSIQLFWMHVVPWRAWLVVLRLFSAEDPGVAVVLVQPPSVTPAGSWLRCCQLPMGSNGPCDS
jgi:hypothetical protein